MKHIIQLADTRHILIHEVIDALKAIALSTNGNMYNNRLYLNALDEAIECDYLDHNYELQGEYYILKQLDSLTNECT